MSEHSEALAEEERIAVPDRVFHAVRLWLGRALS